MLDARRKVRRAVRQRRVRDAEDWGGKPGVSQGSAAATPSRSLCGPRNRTKVWSPLPRPTEERMPRITQYAMKRPWSSTSWVVGLASKPWKTSGL